MGGDVNQASIVGRVVGELIGYFFLLSLIVGPHLFVTIAQLSKLFATTAKSEF